MRLVGDSFSEQIGTDTRRRVSLRLMMAGSVAAAGYLGLMAGAYLFPGSNVLGGFAVVFGPIQWLGLLGLVAMILAWTAVAGLGD